MLLVFNFHIRRATDKLLLMTIISHQKININMDPADKNCIFRCMKIAEYQQHKNTANYVFL